MGDSLIRSLSRALFVAPADRSDGLNLRLWFVGFVGWLVALTAVAGYGLVEYESGGRVGMAVWLLALYVFYMSLCCTFFPAPTTWIVMLAASNYVAGEIGVADYPMVRVAVVACLGAWGTAMANLNEYHVFTFLLRNGRLGKVRKTRIYEVAARWFSVKPFWVIVLFSFIPIPVDVIRWLAITYRYPRLPYFGAYYLGRWVRYAGLAGVTIWGQLTWVHILIIQTAVALIALAKIIQQVVRQHRAGRKPDDPERQVDVQAAEVADTIHGQPSAVTRV